MKERERRLARQRENYRLRQANISTEDRQRQSQERTERTQQRRTRYVFTVSVHTNELSFMEY